MSLCQRIGKRIALRGAHMAFDGWFDGTQLQIALRALMVRVAKTIANTGLSKCLRRWVQFLDDLDAERQAEQTRFEIERERRKQEFLLHKLFKNL